MERTKQLQFGLLGVIALLLVANMFGGGFKSWFKNEGDQIRETAVTAASSSSIEPAQTGNIPGTNVNQTTQTLEPPTSIKFEQEVHDFGVVDEGDVVKHIFKFTNVGPNPLVISNARASCGCTVPSWPKEPIPPNGTGEIKVEFNSKGKPGSQSKTVTVTGNTNPTETQLTIKGEVKGKEQPTAKGLKSAVE
jgi:Protein of unknown function (DUF1573)